MQVTQAKISPLLFALLAWVFCFESKAQSLPDSIAQKTFTLNLNKVQMSDILNDISKQTGMLFSYKNATVVKLGKYSFSNKQLTLAVFCNEYLKSRDINYVFIPPNIIVLNPFKPTIPKAFTINGFVSDSASGEKLISSNILLPKENVGVASNYEGFFSIQTHNDTLYMQISYIGYQTKYIELPIADNLRLDIKLSQSLNLPIVIVTNEEDKNSLTQENGNLITLKGKKITDLSPLFGESDVFRTLQLLPGIQSVGEGAPGLFVRGGSPDQNLVLLDGIQIYNPIHIFGFYSIFNPGIVKNVALNKGSFPAKYSGRLSSVIDVITVDGNSHKIQGEAMLGIMGSRLSIDGPIGKSHKTTFMVSGRRSHIDLLLAPFLKANLSTQNAGFLTAYYFYDINAKIVHRFNKNAKITLSFYNGGDNISLNNSFKLDNLQHKIKEKDRQSFAWGNKVAAIRWGQILSSKTILKTTAWYSSYDFGNTSRYSFEETTKDSSSENFFDYRFESFIRDIGVNSDIEYFITEKWKLNGGVQFISHMFQPGVTSLTSNLPNLEPAVNITETSMGNEASVYIDNGFNVGKKIKVNLGLNYTEFLVQSKQYPSLQPRVSVMYNLNKRFIISVGYAQMQQYLHLLANSSIGIPQDLWILSSDKIMPQNNSLYNLSFKQELKFVDIGLDLFYKNMNNVIDYKDGENYLKNTNNWEDKITIGTGKAMGIELFIEKEIGRFTGWIGYCLSNSTRQFADINEGKPFLYRYNRTHDLSSTASYKINDRNTISINFIYATGTPITIPEQIYSGLSASTPTVDIFIPGKRNNFIMADYNRLDINYSNYKKNKLGIRVWSFGFYNVYNKQNPFFISPGYNDNGERVLRQVTLFPIIPSITYKQEF